MGITSKQKYNFSEILIYVLSLQLGSNYFSVAIPNILIGVSLLIFLIGILKKQITLNFNKENNYKFFLVIVPFLLTSISTILSNNKFLGLEYIWLRLPILIIPFFILFSNSYTKKSMQQGILIFIFSSIVASIISVFKFSYIFLNGNTILELEEITFIQHQFFGVFLLVALILTIKTSVIKKPLFKNGGLIVLIIGMLLSGSRLVYILLFLFLITVLSNHFSLKKKLLFIGIAFIGVVSIINSNKLLHDKFFNTFNYWKSPRIWVWENSYRVIKNSDSKILGIGIGDYFTRKKKLTDFKRTTNGTIGYDVHNQYLEFIIHNGILGLFFVFSMFKLYFYVENKNLLFIYWIIALFLFADSILGRQLGIQLYSIVIPFLITKIRNE